MKNSTHLFLLFLCLILSSCVSINSIHDGRTLGQGNCEIALAANTGDTSRYAYNHAEDFVDLNLELDVSCGVTDRLDLGLKITPAGTGAINTKFQYLGNKQSLFASSVALEGGFNVFEFFIGTYSYYGAAVSHNSIHFTDKICFFVNPKYVFIRHNISDWQSKQHGDPEIIDTYNNLLYSYGLIIGKKLRFGFEITNDGTFTRRPLQIGCSISYVFK